MKRALTKKIGRTMIQYHGLEDVLLDIECFMNNRSLCYIWIVSPADYLEEGTEETEYEGCTRIMRYLSMCREHLRKR